MGLGQSIGNGLKKRVKISIMYLKVQDDNVKSVSSFPKGG